MQRVVRWSIIAAFAGLLVVVVLAMVAPSIFGRWYLRAGDVFLFPDLSGPPGQATVAEATPTRWQRLDDGTDSRLAILLTDENSAWLGLVHGLQSIGVPFRLTDEPAEALEHRVVLVYPMLAGSVLNASSLEKLGAHVRGGGTLIAVNALGGGLNQVFGFESVKASRANARVRFDTGHALAADFTDPAEQEIRIGKAGQDEKSLGTHEYLEPRYPPLATFENGAAAITWRAYGGGHAFALGFDPGLVLQKAHGYRLGGVAPAYVNVFEPTIDVILRLLRNMYTLGETRAVTLYTVPWNRALSVNITHDIDYNESLANAVEYAAMERALGVTGTFFVQTKYVRDWNDKVFFNNTSPQYLRALNELGMEIGSHTVAHSKVFSRFPLGTGAESYPDYVPFVNDDREAFGGSVLGELRVSKFLLDQFSDGAPVQSFRAGYLENPFTLPQALVATGYRYDSTITANNTLTHLPYRLNHGRGPLSEVAAWEFPVTIEDERPPELTSRLDQALDVARKIARYGGHYVVLMHPNETGEKLDFLRQLITALQPDAWFGSMAESGQWWEAREQVAVDVASVGDSLQVTLNAPLAIAGLTLELPGGSTFLQAEPVVQTTQTDNRLTLEKFQGELVLTLTRTEAP